MLLRGEHKPDRLVFQRSVFFGIFIVANKCLFCRSLFLLFLFRLDVFQECGRSSGDLNDSGSVKGLVCDGHKVVDAVTYLALFKLIRRPRFHFRGERCGGHHLYKQISLPLQNSNISISVIMKIKKIHGKAVGKFVRSWRVWICLVMSHHQDN